MQAGNQMKFDLPWQPADRPITPRPSPPAQAGEPLRVLRVAHASLTPALRARERALAACYPEIALAVATTASWQEAGVEVKAQSDELFPVITAKTYFSRHIQLFAYDPRPLQAALRRHRPHLIDLNHEPYSLPCAEVLWLCRRYAPDAAIVLQTAQNLDKRYPPPFSWLEQRAFRQVDGAFVCSMTVHDRLRAHGFRRPIELIPFGVDLAQFKPRPLASATSRPFTIGFVGRMLPGKGLPLLAAALQGLAGENWRALFVGDGPERGPVARQLAAAGLSQRVTMTGAVPYETVPDYLQQMDVLVVPSQTTKNLREQFGRVIVEAMASRVCVVGSRSGAIPEVIGQAGLLVPESDAPALSQALRQLLRSPALCRQLACAGRERVEEHYTWERVAEQTAAFYRQILEARGQLSH